MGKRRKASHEVLEAPIDLASRIGAASPVSESAAGNPEPIRRVDGPIDSVRAARHIVIGANEPPPDRAVLLGVNEIDPARREIDGRPTMIGLEESLAALATAAIPPQPIREEPDTESAGSVPREAPSVGEMDLVVTPLPTPDDWHHFELALRRVPGVGPLRIEYYRAGILKLRLAWSGADRFANAVARTPGYRVGILGQDRNTVQIRVVRA